MSITNTTKSPRIDWLFGGNPAAIEDQEAQGQTQLVSSSQLPAKINYGSKESAAEQYQKMGIKVIGPSNGDDLFLNVELPTGWKIEPTDHSMWSELRDNQGRKRAMIFYKAAFYDRDAFINLERRYSYKVDRLGFLNGDYSRENKEYVSYKTPLCGWIMDQDRLVVQFDGANIPIEHNPTGGYTRDYIEACDDAERRLKDACLTYLNSLYPAWESFFTYWDPTPSET
jgi:hypothetical protein